MTARTMVAMVLLVGCIGCTDAANAQPKTADHDRPVPASEPRQQLALTLDLLPSSACEERFDLALYTDRRIELIQWDERVGACSSRAVTIRYLSKKITQKQLLEQVRKHAKVVE